MSKTDKTSPWWVKQHYDHSYIEPVHRHEAHECNLPPRPSAKEMHNDRTHKWSNDPDAPCFWWPSLAFYRSRWALCGCYMCSPDAYDMPRSKRERKEKKRYVRDGWRNEY